MSQEQLGLLNGKMLDFVGHFSFYCFRKAYRAVIMIISKFCSYEEENLQQVH